MPRVAPILVLLFLVAPSAAAALPPPVSDAVRDVVEATWPIVEPPYSELTGPRTVQYVNVPGWEWYGCQIGGGPADATGACFASARTNPGEHAWLFVQDERVEGCVAVNVFVNYERAPRHFCAGPEGVDLGEAWHVIVGFRDAGDRTATYGTATLAIRSAA